MNAVTASSALAIGLVATAVLGPRVLRQAAPALMRAPRVAVAVVSGGVIAWTAALVALGPMVAWAAGGPSLLAGSAGDVCQRCLASANPFSGAAGSFALPAVVPLALAALAAVAILGGVAAELLQRRRDSQATAEWLAATATSAIVSGHRVLVIEDASPYAWTLPSRHGGIVVSSGALDALSDSELDAVLAHERAHLLQRHHVVAAVAAGLRRTLGWVPYVRAATAALPHYLEISADAHAQRLAGTRALASALLILGSPTMIAGARADRAGLPVLHAAGPERIGRLVGAVTTRGGAWSASLAASVSIAYGALGLAIVVPYGIAVVTGCV